MSEFITTAQGVLAVAERLGVDALAAAAFPATWQHGASCVRHGDPMIGYRLLLTALAQTPDAAQALLQGLADYA